MIEQIKMWVKNIVLIVLFANFIEMLLPHSKFRGYIRVVIGFFVILVIMGPIMELLSFKDLSKEEKKHNLKLLDAIIVASANYHNCSFVTADKKQ